MHRRWRERRHERAKYARNYKLALLRDPDDEPLRGERKDIVRHGGGRDLALNIMFKDDWFIYHNLKFDSVMCEHKYSRHVKFFDSHKDYTVNFD